MDYRAALDWLYSTQMFGIKLGLENARRLVAALDAFPEGKCVIHVAGTNGKGSVCAMAESIARTAGFRTGLFTSPHLVRYNERIQISGQEASDDEIAEGLSRLCELTSAWDPHPTFFELTTALGLWLFKKHDCEVIVLETGMGGRLDATNVVTPSVSVLTKIDLDHCRWLGDTLEKIAGEKAGIIKPGIPAVTFPQSTGVLDVFQKTTTLLTIAPAPHAAGPVGLPGEHQKWNAALAILALEKAGLAIPAAAISKGLRDVSWPGRFQEICPGMFLDGAHNPAAAATLVETWKTDGPAARPTLLIGMLSDKDILATLTALAPLAAAWIAVTPRSSRSLPADELATEIKKVSVAPVSVAESTAPSLLHGPRPLLVCGSLFLVGEVLAWFQNQPALRPSAQ